MPNFKPSKRSSSTKLTVSAQPPSQNARRISHPRLLWLSSANNNLFFTQAFDSHNSINIHYKNSSNMDQLFYACQPLKQQTTIMFAPKKRTSLTATDSASSSLPLLHDTQDSSSDSASIASPSSASSSSSSSSCDTDR